MNERVEQPAVYRVLMSDVLFEELGVEAVDWGEPDAEGFYTPTVRAATWDRIAEARAAERERIATAVDALPDDCHHHEGLGCAYGTVDGEWVRICYSLQREDVLAIVEDREPRYPKDAV